jgi:hypothetical protein
MVAAAAMQAWNLLLCLDETEPASRGLPNVPAVRYLGSSYPPRLRLDRGRLACWNPTEFRGAVSDPM